MKAFVLERGKIRITHVPDPNPSAGEALIKVFKAGICKTDVELAGEQISFEGIPGHEFVGRVEQASDQDWIDK